MADDSFIRHNFVLISATLAASTIHYLFQFAMGRMLGPADYGILAALFSIVYITIAPMQAVQLTLTKFIAELNALGQLDVAKSLLWQAIKKIAIVSVVFVFALIAAGKLISDFLNMPSGAVIAQFSLFFFAIFVLSAARGAMQGLQKFKTLGINLVVESSIKLIASLLLVFGGFGIIGAIWGMNLSVFAAFLLAAVSIIGIFGWQARRDITKFQRHEIYKYAIPMLIALSVVTMLYSVDVILVKHFFSAHEAGIYAAAALVAKVIFFVLLPISQVMFPKVAELEVRKQPHGFIFLKSVALVAGLSAIAVAVYFIRPTFVLNFLFGSAYNEAIPLIGMFGLAIALLSVSYVFINYFLSAGKTFFVYLLPLFVFVEVWLIWHWHSSLYQTVTLLAVVMGALLLTLAGGYFIIYGFNKQRGAVSAL